MSSLFTGFFVFRLEKQNQDTTESKKQVMELRYRIELLENKMKEVQRSLPSTAGYVIATQYLQFPNGMSIVLFFM